MSMVNPKRTSESKSFKFIFNIVQLERNFTIQGADYAKKRKQRFRNYNGFLVVQRM